jgi:PAS domain S-box-containing protein
VTEHADQPRLTTGFTNAILESISDGVFTVDSDFRVTSFNRAAERITGVCRGEALGRHCSEVLRSSLCEDACALRATLENGKPIINRSCFIVNGNGRRIPISVSTAVLRDAEGRIAGGAETFRDLSEIEELKRELSGRVQIGDLVSQSPRMRRIFDVFAAVADSLSTVLIQGATGTGKELLAHAIHGAGPRKDGPFVAVNCGALPDTLLESELFGYKAGAFTGAQRDKAGRFALAEGGTLFLDEIGEMSRALQVRLLRVLQERTYEPLGSTGSVRTDTRVITATNADLSRLVQQGWFRQDLYYRINVVRLELPPLRDRREDIPLLVQHFLDRLNRREAKGVTGVSPEALSLFTSYDYPGNVRELQNVVEHAFVVCDGQTIDTRHLPPEIADTGPVVATGSDDLAKRLRTVEAHIIRQALRRNKYNRLATARALGLHKTTLFRKMKALGVEFPERDGRRR